MKQRHDRYGRNMSDRKVLNDRLRALEKSTEDIKSKIASLRDPELARAFERKKSLIEKDLRQIKMEVEEFNRCQALTRIHLALHKETMMKAIFVKLLAPLSVILACIWATTFFLKKIDPEFGDGIGALTLELLALITSCAWVIICILHYFKNGKYRE